MNTGRPGTSARDRLEPLRQRLAERLESLQLPEHGGASANLIQLEARPGCRPMATCCELKEAQIRLGLHTFGTLPGSAGTGRELLLALARPPQAGLPGLTQALAQDLRPAIRSLGRSEEDSLAAGCRQAGACRPLGRPCGAAIAGLRHVGDGVALLEPRALEPGSQQACGTAA
jgi:cobaltochelatase CobN